MSKICCQCGNLLSDVVSPCPTEGWLMGDQNSYAFYRDFTREVEQFLEAVRSGQRATWIEQRFDGQYPQEISDAEIISDLLSARQDSHILSTAECDSCGRLHIQTEPEQNVYRAFVPEEPGYHYVLARKRVPHSNEAEQN